MSSTAAVRAPGLARVEPAAALAAFALFCVTVLTVAPVLFGPDGDAYRASILAITDGHFLSLSASQAHALAAQMSACPKSASVCNSPGPDTGPGSVFMQWVRLPGGRWLSEKNPGYPFLAAPFQELGLIRLAPLFYGALACLGLYAGAGRWLGRPGGAIAVGLFCCSDLTLIFAWQDYWESFTDASLIAAGTGAILWALLADGTPTRRRTAGGLLGFLAIEAAVFARYTDAVVLLCAIAAVLIIRRQRPGTLPPHSLRWWLGSAALFAAGLAAFDVVLYGGPVSTGYRPGEITFSISAIGRNLRYLPGHLIQTMPVLVLGLAGLIAIVARRVRLRRDDTGRGREARRDFAVAIGLGASWLALWGLYAAYTWTAQPGIGPWQSARFYLPAVGSIALLGSWLLVRLPRLADPASRAWLGPASAAAVVTALFALGAVTFRGQAGQLGSTRPHGPPPQCNIGQPHCHATPPPASPGTRS